MRISLRSAALVTTLVASTVVPLAGAAPAAVSSSVAGATQSPDGPMRTPRIIGQPCGTDDGVTVVVDFRNLLNAKGKQMNLVKLGCAEQPVGDGFDALLGAGFKVDPTQAFVCTIDDRTLNPDSCPPSDGYWTYSQGQRGDRNWTLSGQGAGDWHPDPGTLEGWSWLAYGGGHSFSFPRVKPRDLFPGLG